MYQNWKHSSQCNVAPEMSQEEFHASTFPPRPSVATTGLGPICSKNIGGILTKHSQFGLSKWMKVDLLHMVLNETPMKFCFYLSI